MTIEEKTLENKIRRQLYRLCMRLIKERGKNYMIVNAKDESIAGGNPPFSMNLKQVQAFINNYK